MLDFYFFRKFSLPKIFRVVAGTAVLAIAATVTVDSHFWKGTNYSFDLGEQCNVGSAGVGNTANCGPGTDTPKCPMNEDGFESTGDTKVTVGGSTTNPDEDSNFKAYLLRVAKESLTQSRTFQTVVCGNSSGAKAATASATKSASNTDSDSDEEFLDEDVNTKDTNGDSSVLNTVLRDWSTFTDAVEHFVTSNELNRNLNKIVHSLGGEVPGSDGNSAGGFISSLVGIVRASMTVSVISFINFSRWTIASLPAFTSSLQKFPIVSIPTRIVDALFFNADSNSSPFADVSLSWPEASVFIFNGIEDRSAEYGVEPWYWYFLVALPKALGEEARLSME